jgi:hypothetical protein
VEEVDEVAVFDADFELLDILELDTELEEAEDEVTVFDVDLEPLDEELPLLNFELVNEDWLVDIVKVLDADLLPDDDEELC